MVRPRYSRVWCVSLSRSTRTNISKFLIIIALTLISWLTDLDNTGTVHKRQSFHHTLIWWDVWYWWVYHVHGKLCLTRWTKTCLALRTAREPLSIQSWNIIRKVVRLLTVREKGRASCLEDWPLVSTAMLLSLIWHRMFANRVCQCIFSRCTGSWSFESIRTFHELNLWKTTEPLPAGLTIGYASKIICQSCCIWSTASW